MGKGIVSVNKNSQNNWIYPSPNTTFFVPRHSVYTTTHVIADSISASPDDTIQTKPLSIPITTNMLATAVNIDDKSQSFATPKKQNHSPNESISNNNVSGQVPFGSHLVKYQQKTTTQTTHQKLPPSGKEYLCFQTDEKNPKSQSEQNQRN